MNIQFLNLAGEPEADPALIARFSFQCARNPGRWHNELLIAGRTGLKRDGQNQNGGIAQWDWDGNLKTPTFKPSIRCGGCCHGYITAGIWDDRGPG